MREAASGKSAPKKRRPPARSAGRVDPPTDEDLVRVNSEELRGMTDEELVKWASTILGLQIQEADLVYKGDRIVGYKRSRILTRILQLAYLVEE